MKTKPVAVIQIALYPDGKIQCGLEGSVSKALVAQGMAGATQALLNRIDSMVRDQPGIEVPPADLSKQLLAAR